MPHSRILSNSPPHTTCVLCAPATCSQGFKYTVYNDVEDLERVVKLINRMGKLRSFAGKPRRAVAAIMMEPLQECLPSLNAVLTPVSVKRLQLRTHKLSIGVPKAQPPGRSRNVLHFFCASVPIAYLHICSGRT